VASCCAHCRRFAPPLETRLRPEGAAARAARGERRPWEGPNPKVTLRLFEETKQRLLLSGRGGLCGNCLRIPPPLTVTTDEVDEAPGKLDKSFAAIRAQADRWGRRRVPCGHPY
jgi:4-aminobutyrate aminotransferase-like enzyme